MTEQTTRLNVVNSNYLELLLDPIEQARELLLSGNYQDCLELVQTQPANLIETSALLMVYQATAMLFSEYPRDEIFSVLTKIEHLQDSETLAGEIAAIRAVIASYTKGPEEGIRYSKFALQHIQSENTFFQNIIERNLGVAYTLRNDLNNANYWFEKLLMSSCQLRDWGGVLAAYNYLTYIRKVQGRLREAEIIYQKALTFIEEHNLERMPHSIKIVSGYGHLLMYWHRLDEAKVYFHKAIRLAEQTDIIYAYTAYQHLCESYVRENNLLAAHATLDELQQLDRGNADFYEKIHLQHTIRIETQLLLADGCIDRAYDWLVSSGFEDVLPNELLEEYGYKIGLTLPLAARIYLMKGMTDQAIQILRAVIPKFIHQDANSYLIRALAALAVAYDQQGQHQLAIKTLSKATILAEAENNLGDFLIMGQSLVPVLGLMLRSETNQAFSLKLMSIVQSNTPRKGSFKYKNKIHALSQREIDVLHLVAEGLTNRQIAEALFLSCNTIKSHRNNIYRKLNVDNRTQAITKACTLGILNLRTEGNFLSL